MYKGTLHNTYEIMSLFPNFTPSPILQHYIRLIGNNIHYRIISCDVSLLTKSFHALLLVTHNIYGILACLTSGDYFISV